jgi:hypothetical protein
MTHNQMGMYDIKVVGHFQDRFVLEQIRTRTVNSSANYVKCKLLYDNLLGYR